jgi:aminoglycoside phosphotransferase (APT) family kinase protein
MHRDATLSATDVRAAVTAVWPDASVVETASLPGKNEVHRASLDGAPATDVVLKAGTATPERVGNESTILDRVASATDLPVPAVRATVGGSDPDNPLDVPYLLMDAVEGRGYERGSDDLQPSTFERVCYEAGRNLGTLHTWLTFDGAGPLQPAPGGLAPPEGDTGWPTVYRLVVESQLDELAGSGVDDRLPDVEAYVDRVTDELRDTTGRDPVFTHMDYRLENLRLRPEARPVTAGILDWGGAAAAPPAYELAHTERILLDWPGADPDRGAAVRERFYDGYTEVGGRQPRESCPERFRHYRLTAHLRALKHHARELQDDPRPTVEDRVDDHVRSVERLLGGG